MSILIKGMEMPRNCMECGVGISKAANCIMTKPEAWKRAMGTGRQPECPLVEIPTPHGRLIDANAIVFTYTVARSDDDGHNWLVRAVEQDEIDDMPTIIEAEGGGEDG